MVTMFSNGITIEVPESEVYLYKRAGYVVVEKPKAEEPIEEIKEKKPAKK